MAWSSLPMRLNRRRTSPMVSLIRRRGRRTGGGLVFCGPISSSGLFVPSARCDCPQVVGPLFRFVCHDREEGQGEHGQGDVPVPGVIEADLVVVQSCLAFRCLGRFLDGPAHSGCPDKLPGSFFARVITMVVGEFSVINGAPDHVLVTGPSRVEQGPVVNPESFTADAAGPALP